MPRVHVTSLKRPCHLCSGRGSSKPKPGFLIETAGCDIQPRVVVNEADGERVLTPGHRRVWRELYFVSDRHLRGALVDIQDNIVACLGDAASLADPGVVNRAGSGDISPLDMPGRGFGPPNPKGA